jgi:glycosyltransferase involved in cell wall biosynthesis
LGTREAIHTLSSSPHRNGEQNLEEFEDLTRRGSDESGQIKDGIDSGVPPRKRIAVFMPGGVGEVNSFVHIPALVNLVSRLSHRFEITVYSVIKPDGVSESFRCGDATVKFIRARYDDHILIRLYHFFMDFRRDHGRRRYDLVHGFWGFPCGFLAVVIGKLFRLPSIAGMQGGEAASIPDIAYGDMRRQPLRALTLWTLNNATTVTALTRFQREQLTRFGFRRRDVAIIPHGVETNRFTSTRTHTAASPFRFLHVANLNPVKDQATLLYAFNCIAQHVDARLRIIGPDYLDGAIQQLCEALSLRDKVEFLGQILQSELPQHYNWADIFLLTSRYEAQGVVIAEAFASGTVVCGTHVGLIHDCDDFATASPIGEHEALADNVINLLNDPCRFETCRSNGLAWATHHDAHWTAMEFVRLYECLLHGTTVPSRTTVDPVSYR